MGSLSGKCALITGAGRGIGKRLAIGFARAGVNVGLIARTSAELDATKLEIDQAKGHAFPFCADVQVYSQLAHAFQRITKKYGSIHLLVAAAGVPGPIGPFVKNSPDAWEELLRTNVLGVMNALHLVLPQMMERRSGKVIVISGDGATYARPALSPYAASKAALGRLVESVAEEVHDHNVQINCLIPGGAYTSMTDEILSAGELAGNAEREEAERIRMTGGMAAEKQMAFAMFLASERSNHISGKIINVHDDLKRLEQMNMTPNLFTLRRAKG